MATISVRDNEGKTHKGLKKLRESKNPENPFKDRSLSYIALEILQSKESVEGYVEKYVAKGE